MSTAGRSLALIMRTCSAFGGLDRSSAARAVAGASSGSITTGADGGLRRQAPILKCLWLPRGLAGQPCSLAKALAGVRGLNPTEWGFSSQARFLWVGGIRKRLDMFQARFREPQRGTRNTIIGLCNLD